MRKMHKISEELTEDIRTVAIAGHVNPDGDCVGSCMGLYLYLTKNYPELHVDIYLEEVKPEFGFISKVEEIQSVCIEGSMYDLIITSDVSGRDRIGVIGDIYEKANKTICIDHHVSNTGFAQVNHIRGEIGSASEVVYELLEEENITKEVAEALYTGIVHDTGVFQYKGTTPQTMNIAGKLMAFGIDFSEIVDKTFRQKTYSQNQILGKILLESFMMLDKRCIIGYVRKREMDFYGVTARDLEGIVSQLRITKGVEVAVFLYEVGNQEYKVSMRSNGKVDVSSIAMAFGGGGHVLAAGCTMQGTAHDVINNLAKYIEKQLEKET